MDWTALRNLSPTDWFAIVVAVTIGWLVILMLVWIVHKWLRGAELVMSPYVVVSGIAGTLGLAVAVNESMKAQVPLSVQTLVTGFLGVALVWPFLLFWALTSRH